MLACLDVNESMEQLERASPMERKDLLRLFMLGLGI